MAKTAKNSLKNFQATIYKVENDTLTPEQFFILENQKHDLKTKNKLTVEKFSKELVFFDLLLKEQNSINKKYLQYNTQNKKQKLLKEFISEFYYIDTPKEKNFEKLLIEKLTNKYIIDYIKELDSIDLDSIKNTIENLEDIKEDIRKTAFEDIEKQKQAKKEYRKIYQKNIQKQLKARYRLAKKYSFLID